MFKRHIRFENQALTALPDHPAHEQAHKRAHSELSEQLNGIVSRFTDSNNCFDAIDGLSRFENAVDEHAKTLDAELHALLNLNS